MYINVPALLSKYSIIQEKPYAQKFAKYTLIIELKERIKDCSISRSMKVIFKLQIRLK